MEVTMPISAASSYKINQAELALAIQQLTEFVAIPSVSNPNSPDYNIKHIKSAADYTAKRLEELGFKVRQVKIGDSAPYVLAEKMVNASKPTLLLYAHYDVQPVDRSKWQSDPFVLTKRDGRLYGRGASDDKGGIIGIITALGAYQKAYGALPVNVKILFEGEEEYGSSHMSALVKQEAARLKADALVILDGGNAGLNTGTLTNSTRGLVNLQLEVKAMEKPIHSGVGCIAPDPAAVLAELMTALGDPKKIPGFMDDCTPLKPMEKEFLRKSSQTSEAYASEHGLVKGAQLRGDPKVSVYERVAEEPSISFVNGGWGVQNGGNSIQESARCQIGVRLTPGQNPDRIAKLLIQYLTSRKVPYGLEVKATLSHEGCYAWKGDLSRPLSQKYLAALGDHFQDTHVQPTGGALPFLRDFQKAFPNMEMIIPGVEDPKCAAHSHNESQDIGLFERAINAMIAFFKKAGS
jgi:acetylornithine deacetylase/succinyl-diaminopimelate desuccinylase-like protein